MRSRTGILGNEGFCGGDDEDLVYYYTTTATHKMMIDIGSKLVLLARQSHDASHTALILSLQSSFYSAGPPAVSIPFNFSNVPFNPTNSFSSTPKSFPLTIPPAN